MRPTPLLPPPFMFTHPCGALLDLSTGEYVEGTHGQMVLLGGVSLITGIVGPGNSFKTTLMRYMILSAISRMYPILKDSLYYRPYDTELNVHERRITRLADSFKNLSGNNLIKEGLIAPTNKAILDGTEFWAETREELTKKVKDKSTPRYDTAFLDRDGVTPMKVITPWFTDIDSLSQFITADVEEMQNKNDLGESGGATIFMRQGLAKTRMLMEMPTVAYRGMNFFLFTGHIGAKIAMNAGPGQAPERKQLSGMRQNEYIKGVTNNFFYLLHNCWLIDAAGPAMTKENTPAYPYMQGEEREGDADLQVIRIKQLRGKNGGSNFTINIYLSQRDGLLPSLSEFCYIKDADRFGIIGNDRTYQLALMPDVNLSRTTIRTKFRESAKLRRAVSITSELLQIQIFHPELKPVLLEPEKLREELIKKGYDWDFILSETRGWNTLSDEEAPGYPLSTLDLCRIVHGTYHPYWLEADCKTVKPEYAKKKVGKLSDFE